VAQKSADYLQVQLDRADARIQQLEDELSASKERVLQLERLLNAPRNMQVLYSAAFDLTAYEAKVFGILMAREHASTEQIEGCLYATRNASMCDKLVPLYVHRIRKKILPRGIAIGLVWGQGYFISPAMKELVRQRLQEWDEAGQPTKPTYHERKRNQHVNV
jgi:hypothetical protein